jgi:hypothetical protein
MEDNSLLATGSNPSGSEYTVTAKTNLKGITGFRLEALTDPNLPYYGPGRADNGNFVLTEFTVEVSHDGTNASTNTIPVPLQNATADFSQPDFPVTPPSMEFLRTKSVGPCRICRVAATSAARPFLKPKMPSALTMEQS